MKKEKIYIIGSGAIGKALAVFLQHENKEVILVRRSVDNLPDEKVLVTVINQDILDKRQTEIDSLNFEILRLANELGMPELVSNTRLLGEIIQLKSTIGTTNSNQIK